MSDIRDPEAGGAAATSTPAMSSAQPQQQATSHTIEVKAKAIGSSIDWEVDGKKPDEAKLKLDKDSGGHEIIFDLDADGALKSRGLRFNCAYPIFVSENTATCPTSGVDDQINVLECSPGKLKVFDKNTGVAKMLRYQLNFVEENGAAPVCDPIIENGGST